MNFILTKRHIERIATSCHAVHAEDGTDATIIEHELSELFLALFESLEDDDVVSVDSDC